jgi:hypothetical protein
LNHLCEGEGLEFCNYFDFELVAMRSLQSVSVRERDVDLMKSFAGQCEQVRIGAVPPGTPKHTQQRGLFGRFFLNGKAAFDPVHESSTFFH